MPKINTILIVFVAVIIVALVGYVVYMNGELKKTVSRYEASAAGMASKFEKVTEDALKAREELARQKVLYEEAKAASEALKIEEAKAISEVKEEVAAPAEPPPEPVKLTKKEQAAADAKARAEKAKAKAEALLGQVSTDANAWENREAHL